MINQDTILAFVMGFFAMVLMMSGGMYVGVKLLTKYVRNHPELIPATIIRLAKGKRVKRDDNASRIPASTDIPARD